MIALIIYFDNLFLEIFLIIFLTLLIIVVISNRFVDKQIALNQLKNEVTLKNNVFYFSFVALIYAPIVEEIVFRGIIYKNIKNSWIYVNTLDKNLGFSGGFPPPLTNHS